MYWKLKKCRVKIQTQEFSNWISLKLRPFEILASYDGGALMVIDALLVTPSCDTVVLQLDLKQSIVKGRYIVWKLEQC